jgi:oligopeptidase B
MTWHDAGRMKNKENTFTDFVDVAEGLVARGLTAPERLTAEGGSAGGLLMGAVVNARPDLFRAIIADVPFVDVLTTMSDTSLPLTVGEFEEWGNPGIEEQYRDMRAYCPYTNAGPADLPSLLVYTSLHDSQVMYTEPTKWVAKLRDHKTDDDPLLLWINLAGGHGGSSGRFDQLRERARFDAFLLWQYGRLDSQPSDDGVRAGG